MLIKLFVPGECIPQPRHRVGKPRCGFPRAYIPEESPVHAFKDAVALAGRQVMAGKRLLCGPVTASLLFLFPLPINMDVFTWKPTKPDIDNLQKSVLDSLRSVVYKDDNQIVFLSSLKAHTDGVYQSGLYAMFQAIGPQADLIEFLTVWEVSP